MKRRCGETTTINDQRSLIEITEEFEAILERQERRAIEARLRRDTVAKERINHKLFGPPIPVTRELQEKFKILFGEEDDKERPSVVLTLEGTNKRQKISIDEYRERHREETNFVVTIPNKFDDIKTDSDLLKPELFSDEDIIQCVRAAIRTLPEHIAPAFTVSNYLWPKPLSVKPACSWAYGIIGCDPKIPPPVRQAPKYQLKYNFSVPPPASQKQESFWRKHWRRLENIILNDVRIYLEATVRQILIQLAKIRKNKICE